MIGGIVQADDIVARLRDYHATVVAAPPYYRELTRIAAEEIEQLQAENATLRRLLDQFVGEFKDEVQREAL